jgi:hypothetical protein
MRAAWPQTMALKFQRYGNSSLAISQHYWRNNKARHTCCIVIETRLGQLLQRLIALFI